MARVLGVIPARGGSKRIPNKNLRTLHGKPLIAYTIEAAARAKSLTEWVVSTDDHAIAVAAADRGAFVVKRPADLASDTATTGSVLIHALDWMETSDIYDFVVCLHPTSPIRDPKHIDDMVELAIGDTFASVASCCMLPSKTHDNIWDEDGYAVRGGYILNASVYVIRRDYLLRHGKHVSDAPFPYFMDRRHSVDIDEEVDLRLAEFLLEEQNGNRE